MNMILIIGILSMVGAAVVNIFLTESKKYCNIHSKNTYSEMIVAGSVFMFLNWIMASQNGSFDIKWIHMIAIVYVGVFFFDAMEHLRLAGKRTNDQITICASIKKSAIDIAILYFIFSYLVS